VHHETVSRETGDEPPLSRKPAASAEGADRDEERGLEPTVTPDLDSVRGLARAREPVDRDYEGPVLVGGEVGN
jgi:hypothetical protein